MLFLLRKIEFITHVKETSSFDMFFFSVIGLVLIPVRIKKKRKCQLYNKCRHKENIFHLSEPKFFDSTSKSLKLYEQATS